MSAIAGAVVGGAIGMAQGQMNNRANKKSQQRTYEYQRKLNEQGAKLGLQMWKDTNARAQVEEYKKAGLSTGLMYEGGGAGGTTSAGSGGSAPSAMPSQINLGMGIDAAQAMAQIELMKAQARKTNVDADNAEGVEKDNTIADTGVKTTQAKGNELANELAGKTLDDRKEIIRQELLKTAGQAQQEQAKGTLATARENVALEQDKKNVAYAIAKTALTEKQIEVSDAQIAKMAEDIAIGKFNVETARNTLGLDKVSGTILQNIVNEIYNAIGYDKNRADQKVDDGKK